MHTHDYSGGCQCGAIRFCVTGRLGDASICHCRMCQKAFGSYYAALVAIGEARLRWTRGRLRHFQSSNLVRRGFCAQCGTPLTYEAPDGIAIAAGAFDDPSALPPRVQYGTEGKLPFVDTLGRLPAHRTEDDIQATPWLARVIGRQHPDHDTVCWPPARPVGGAPRDGRAGQAAVAVEPGHNDGHEQTIALGGRHQSGGCGDRP